MARKKATTPTSINRRALRIDQNDEHPLYMFALTSEELLRVADISRIARDEGGNLIGYQRPDVRKHVQNIVEYLDQDSIIFPNSIILALSSSVKFKQSRGPATDDGLAKSGTLEIPLPSGDGPKPAWIVDGQQRAIALSKCKKPNLSIPVNAFVADEVDLQRDQFLRVNSSKPLPPGLITELLPEVNTLLPANLSKKKIPAVICDWLNREKSSPFCGMMKRPSTPEDQKAIAVIADNSIMRMVEKSIQGGCLFPYRNVATGEVDLEAMTQILSIYWGGVKSVFPDAWGKPPAKSRLMHGAGILAMGRLMDMIMPSVDVNSAKARSQVIKELNLIAPTCRWTKGKWEELGDKKWNDFQNMHKDYELLTNTLLRQYMRAKGHNS